MTLTETLFLDLIIEGTRTEREVVAVFDYTPAEDEGCVYKAPTASILSLEYRWEDKYQTKRVDDCLHWLDQYAVKKLEKRLISMVEQPVEA